MYSPESKLLVPKSIILLLTLKAAGMILSARAYAMRGVMGGEKIMVK
jgi:hypothetical protein